jgi:hypothetical protein
MLRVEVHHSADSLSLRLEGRFTGNDAENTRALMARCQHPMTLVVDLTEVTFIDSVGEEVLSFFGLLGAEFVAQTSYTLDMCERLHLRLAPGPASDTNTSGASRTSAGRPRARVRQLENEKV